MEVVYEETMELIKELNLLSVGLRVVLAVVCGGVIGIERGRSHQPAGMRTYMLVCLGATMVMTTGQYMYEMFGTGDPARLGAQVVSGIGFLGAGSIITSGQSKVRGLTTAAGLWAAACIGLALGIGFYSAGILATLAVYLIMAKFKKIEYRFFVDNSYIGIYIELDPGQSVTEIAKKITECGYEIEEIQRAEGRKEYQRLLVSLKSRKEENREEMQQRLEAIDGIRFTKYIF